MDIGQLPLPPRWSRSTTAPAAGAAISADGLYRYTLWRREGPPIFPQATFVMLNPSTAGALLDDPTVRRCAGFAERIGARGFRIVNLYAYRATDPRALLLCAEDPVGPENDRYIREAVAGAATVIVAWGALRREFRARAAEVTSLLAEETAAVFCFGATRSGDPRPPVVPPARRSAGALERNPD